MASKRATISVEWGYELHSLTLTAKHWARVKSGKPLSIRGNGYRYEGEFIWDYWSFDGGLDGGLRVTYGNDGGCGFEGALDEACIEEHS